MIGDQFLEQEELKRKQEKLFEQQKKFRNLESDKKYFADETIKAIKKQKMTIDKLKKENESLKQLIAKVNNERNQDNAHGASFEHMKELLNEIAIAIQSQKQTQKNIDTHIDNFQKKIIEKRKNCMGVNSGAENENNLQKQIKILQNRLDKANQKFNETIAVNRQLKNVIDSLRRQRVIFDNLYQKLQKQLHQKRKKMADIIQRANGSYEERDKANNQVQVLKSQAKKQAAEFEREIKEMSHLMEKIKLTSFVKNIGGNKAQLEQAAFFYETQPQNVEVRNAKPTKKSSQQMEKVQKFREDFAKIEAATEIENFDELLRIFSDNQEKNFQMFKFVNLQSNQIEQLEIEVARHKDEQQYQNPISTGEGKQKLIADLETRLKFMKKKLFQVEETYKKSQREAKTLSNLIERIFETIQCDREVAKQVGGSKTISQTNLMIFLAIIEHKSIQIINTFKQLSNSHMMGNAHKPSIPQPSLLTFQDFEDNEEYDTILTVQQLRKKAADFILKEQGQKQKKKEVRPKKK